ncbi:MAG: Gfo/Idh/MocA family oxidoreductase, partial [Pseudomonadota bacterium]
PQETHAEIALAAMAHGKHVLCEKPLATTLAECEAMVAAAETAGVVNMTGFNYIKTPATQFARKLITDGAIGQLTWFRGEHTEDFLANPETPLNWRTEGRSTGAMGDLSPHIIQCALALAGPIDELVANIVTLIPERPDGSGGSGQVTNDDAANMLCRFANGASGELMVSRTASGRKMGYAYEVAGTEGAIRFDQEDQNALWLYSAKGPEAERGFAKILTGPSHPDYLPFCQGPGHGTGYLDQIIIEAAHFLTAIDEGRPAWPDFAVGRDVQKVVDAAFRSHETRAWQTIGLGVP